MRIFEQLRVYGFNYPVPMGVLEGIARARGLDLQAEYTAEARAGAPFRLAAADVSWWVSGAPDVSQAGVSFRLDPQVRMVLRQSANAVYGELGDASFDASLGRPVYGYKGKKL